MSGHEPRSGIICAGNWIVDIVHEIDHWPQKSDLALIRQEVRGVGGGAANVAMALARFETGLPLTPVGAVGDDDYAALILEQCAALGLSTDHLHRRSHVPTAHTHVMSVPGDSRTFFYQGGANDSLSPEDFPTSFFRSSKARIFYLGYLMLLAALDHFDSSGTTGASRLIERAKKAGLITCIDLVSSSRSDFADVVKPSLPFIDYLIINEIEACRASGLPLPPEQDMLLEATLEEAAALLLARGVEQAVIIHCPQKALWLGRGEQSVWSRPDQLSPEKVISPVGAGDAFCAGILYAIHEGFQPDKALSLGHAAARASLAGMTATGAIPPLSDIPFEGETS